MNIPFNQPIVNPASAGIFIFKNDATVNFALKQSGIINQNNGPIDIFIYPDKKHFLESLSQWVTLLNENEKNNLTNNIHLCIYAHMGKKGLASTPNGPVITWNELKEVLIKKVAVLWLLGCESIYAICFKNQLCECVTDMLIVTSKPEYWGPAITAFQYSISTDPIIYNDKLSQTINADPNLDLLLKNGLIVFNCNDKGGINPTTFNFLTNSIQFSLSQNVENQNNMNQMLSILKEKALQGNICSMLMLGIHYMDQADDKQAFRYFKLAAEKNNAEAQFWMGFFYEFGCGFCEVNVETARDWYTKAAEQNNNNAKMALKRIK